MAIKSNLNLRGVEIADVITRVFAYKGYKESEGLFILEFAVSHHVEDESVKFPPEDYACPIDLEGPNPIKQAYLYLKTLPKYSNAVDWQL